MLAFSRAPKRASAVRAISEILQRADDCDDCMVGTRFSLLSASIQDDVSRRLQAFLLDKSKTKGLTRDELDGIESSIEMVAEDVANLLLSGRLDEASTLLDRAPQHALVQHFHLRMDF